MEVILQIFLVLAIGFGLGGASAWYSIQRSHGIGAINIAQWTAWPFSGGKEADPYTVARVISDSTIPLGAAEGLAFEATQDSEGNQLLLECNYILEGNTPKAKLWTLAPYRQSGGTIFSVSDTDLRSYHTNSKRIIRFGDGTFRIALGPQVSSGNWVTTNGKGQFRLVLRLYDTPITSSAGLFNPAMPSIVKSGCKK